MSQDLSFEAGGGPPQRLLDVSVCSHGHELLLDPQVEGHDAGMESLKGAVGGFCS